MSEKYAYQTGAEGQLAGNEDTTFTCVGYRNEYSVVVDATRDCIDKCPFVSYGKGKHWSDDYVKCCCPEPNKVFPGD